MKIYVISDNIDTCIGLRLAGINGSIVHTKEELTVSLKKILADGETGILLIVEKLAKKFSEIINELKLNLSLPLIVEIPDRHGSGRSEGFISDYIKEAIGVSIDV